jgi:5-methylcytosine-specific restriction endonuclease McrA
MERKCSKCKQIYELTKDNFGHTPSGGFRHTCRSCMRKTVSKHSKENQEMVKARLNKRRNIVASQSYSYDREELSKKLYIYQNGQCFYCKKITARKQCDLEHMTPISKGGKDNPTNIALSCYHCNKEKHNKTVDEYREWMIKNKYTPNF